MLKPNEVLQIERIETQRARRFQLGFFLILVIIALVGGLYCMMVKKNWKILSTEKIVTADIIIKNLIEKNATFRAP